MTPEEQFEDIAERMSLQHEHVGRGKMMSSPGIQYKGKNIAFFWDGRMVFRCGKGFEPESLGVTEWAYLNPFKEKPPMKGWYVVPPSGQARWAAMAEKALEVMQAELG